MDVFPATITPVLTIRNAAEAVTFYQRAFGAEEIYRNTYPDGRRLPTSARRHSEAPVSG